MGFFKHGYDLKIKSRTNTVSSSTGGGDLPNIDYASLGPIAHTLSVEQLVERLITSQKNGLSKNEAARRLQTCGSNALEGDEGVSALEVLIKQLGVL
ncbi:hypothetical protein H0H93_008728 [Arthromyces matolae]|nr:hypothetical protein H0H93_008728 [Arthromyces matolae]